MKLSTLWLKGLTPDDKKELTLRVIENQRIIEAVQKIIADKAKSANRELLKQQYESPAWSELTADRIGYLRALEEMKSVLTLRD